MYKLLFLVCTHAAFGKVLTTQGHPVQQYIHVTGVPSLISGPQSRSSNQNIGILVPTQLPKPDPTPIPSPPPSPTPTSSSNPTKPSKKDLPTLDSNVLNNLAIALQLLIVSNILNLPPQEGNAEIATKMALTMDPSMDAPYSPPSFIIESPKYEMGPTYSVESLLSQYAEPVVVPNANFLGSSDYMEQNIFGAFTPMSKPSPRSDLGFMSPYDAMGPNSPYSDPIITSAYSSTPSKRDFQSPYAAILSDNKDVFSVFDLF